jgi:hypothetical protein
MQFTVGLSGMSFLCIFSSQYNLGGTETCGTSMLVTFSGYMTFL